MTKRKQTHRRRRKSVPRNLDETAVAGRESFGSRPRDRTTEPEGPPVLEDGGALVAGGSSSTQSNLEGEGPRRHLTRRERAALQSERDRGGHRAARGAREAKKIDPLRGHFDRVVQVLLLAGFLLRIIYLLEFRKSDFFDGLVLDEANYDAWAREIAGGDFFGNGGFTANPLGPYMLALVYSFFGRSLVTVRVVQMLVDMASCYFIYRVAHHVFNRQVARAALLFAVLYGPMIFFSANLVAEVWVMFFISASLMLLTHPEHQWWRRGLAGALFACAIMGRPNLVLMMPILPFVVALADEGVTWNTQTRQAAVWFAGVVLVLGAVSLRNVAVGAEVSPLPAHGWVNMWIGNNPDADGFFRTPRGSGLAGGQKSLVSSSIRVAEKAWGRELTAAEASGYWRERVFDFVRDEPGQFGALMAKKVGYFFNAYEKPLETNYHYGKVISYGLRFLTIGYGLVCPLALLGMALALRSWRRSAVLFVFVGVYAASVIISFISMRYRMPVVLGLFPFAGFAVVRTWDWIRAREKRRLVTVGWAGTAALLVVHLPLVRGEVPHDIAHSYFMLGNIAQKRGDWALALERHQKAVELYPEWSGYYNNLGLAYLKNEQPEKAVETLEKAIELDQKTRRVFRNLAKGYRALGQYDKAAEAFRNALEHSPRHIPTFLDLGAMLTRLGRTDEALALYERGLPIAKSARRRKDLQARIDRLKRSGRVRQGATTPEVGVEGEAVVVEPSPVEGREEAHQDGDQGRDTGE